MLPRVSSLQCPTTLIVARHADAEYESKVWAEEGGSLTRDGREQARALASRLADRRVAHIWTSTMSRAVQTAEIAAAALGVGVTTRLGLREFEIGDAAGSSAKDPFAPIYDRWLAGDLDARMPGAENGHEIVERFRGVLEEIVDQHPGETVLVVSHGGVIRMALPMLLTREPEHPPAALANCACVEAEVDADEWICTTWPPAGQR
jgi:probable phosphoglycerate mutase